MKWWHVYIVCVIVASAILGIFVYKPALEDSYAKMDKYYSGTIILESEQAYSEFKLELAKYINRRGNTLDDIKVLSSAPPIIVSFRLWVPHDVNFAYGEYREPGNMIWKLIFYCVATLLLLMIPIIAKVMSSS